MAGRSHYKIALIQMASVPGNRDANLAYFENRIAMLDPDVDIAVMPECADIGYVPERSDWLQAAAPVPGPTTKRLSDIAVRYDIGLVCGILEADAAVDGVYFSTAVLVDKRGTLIGSYRKSHLYPAEHQWLRPGDELPVFDMDGLRIGIAICFEAAIPQVFTEYAAQGAHLVLNPSAVPVGFDDLQDIRTAARSADNQIFTAAINRAGQEGGVAYCGGSQLCNPKGHVVAKAGDGEEETVIAEIDLNAILPERMKEPSFRALRPSLYRLLRTGWRTTETVSAQDMGQSEDGRAQ
jgi:predicted amidohydrolase